MFELNQRPAASPRRSFDGVTRLVRLTRALLGGEDRERSRQLAVIGAVGRLVNSALEMPTILRAVARELRRVVPYHRLNFAFYDEAADTIVQHHVFAGDWETVRPPLVLAAKQTLTWRVMQERRTAYTTDVRESSIPRQRELAAEGVLCTVSVPIMREERCLGVLNVDGGRTDAFSRSQIRFLEVLTAHLSAAVDNARLFTKLRHELSQRRLSERALEEHRDFLQAVIDAVPDPIYVKDAQHRWMLGNRTAWQLFNLDPDAALGKSDARTTPTETSGTFWDQDDHVLRTGQTLETEEAIVDASGGKRHVLIKKSRCLDASDRPVLVGIIRDITALRAVERAKSEFVSVVSHELRTPLTSIRGSLGLVAAGVVGEVPPRAGRMLDIAVSNTDRLMRLINDIIDIERLETGVVSMQKARWSAGDLMRQATDAMEAMADTAGVRLVAAPSDAQIWADADRILQTLTNLLSNAIKFSPPDSTVSLTAERRPDEVLFKVMDRGRGIPRDKLATIFERFGQVDASDSREKGGAGLGLPICRQIVEQHGGQLWVESTPDEGSTFLFTIPTTTPAPAEPPVMPPVPLLALGLGDPQPMEIAGSR